MTDAATMAEALMGSGTLPAAFESRGRIEIIRVLELARLQIEDMLRDSNDSVENLLGAVSALLQGSVADAREDPRAGERTAREAERVIHAMQFYDLLEQRIGHLHEGLAALAELLESPTAAAPEDWSALHERIRAMSRNESDRRLLDAVVRAEQPNRIRAADCPQVADTGDLELF